MTTSQQRGHAVIIGGSMNGMVVATALAPHFDRVTLLDRDTLTDEPVIRRRAPQGVHPNLVQMVGRRELDRFFPGLIDDLKSQGAYEFDLGSEVARFNRFGWSKPEHLDRSSLAATRPLVEARARRIFRGRFEHVRVIDGISVTGYRFEGEGENLRVVGVTTDRDDAALASIDADFVVDCGGRGSKAFRWLSERGVPEPEEWRVDAQCNYATRYFKPPAAAEGYWWKCMAIEAKPPEFPRGAVLLPTEDGRWLVTAIGINGDYAPTEADAWMKWVRDLRAPAMAEVLEDAEPLTDVVQSRTMVNYWKQMHTHEHLVHGLLPFGDVYAAFNPSYGQGLTSGALAARVLADLLDGHRGALDASFARKFYKQQAKLLHEGWRYSTGLDFRWPKTVGERTLAHRIDSLGAGILEEVSAHDPKVMQHLLPLLDFGANYWTLANPAFVSRILWYLLKKGLSGGPRALPKATEFDPRAHAQPFALPA